MEWVWELQRVESEDTRMRRFIRIQKVASGGFNVFLFGSLYGWALMLDTARSLGQVAFLSAF